LQQHLSPQRIQYDEETAAKLSLPVLAAADPHQGRHETVVRCGPIFEGRSEYLSMAAEITDEDPEFLRQWETCTLPFEQWTHRAHAQRRHFLRHPSAIDDTSCPAAVLFARAPHASAGQAAICRAGSGAVPEDSLSEFALHSMRDIVWCA